MPRTERKKSRTGIYHLVARGIGKGLLFEQDEDYQQFLDFLLATKERSSFTLFAYCLLGNHFHLLLREGTEPISHIFRRLGTRYAQWFNHKYERSGHLFQNRLTILFKPAQRSLQSWYTVLLIASTPWYQTSVHLSTYTRYK